MFSAGILNSFEICYEKSDNVIYHFTKISFIGVSSQVSGSHIQIIIKLDSESITSCSFKI